MTVVEMPVGVETTVRSVVGERRGEVTALAMVRDAVGELVARDRGPGWRVAVREVAVLRTFRHPVAGDALTTTVTCRPAGDDEVVASGSCACGSTVLATVTARLVVRRAAL